MIALSSQKYQIRVIFLKKGVGVVDILILQ